MKTEVSAKSGTGELWCLADPHFSGEDPAIGTFFDLLSKFGESQADTLVLLGDLFEVWVALDHAQTETQERVLAALNELSSQGKALVYLVGNRDYFTEGLVPRPFTFVGEKWDFDRGGVRVRFEHGDLINTSDKRYLRWRAFSRGRGMSAAFRLLPAVAQRRLAGTLARRMARTNMEYREYWPEREMGAWAGDLCDRGFRAAVLGHFHLERELQIGGLKVHLLPQFREDGRYLKLTATGEWSLEKLKRASPF